MLRRRMLDQSLLNVHFRSNYSRLPYSYNVRADGWKRPPPVPFTSMAILHYVGEPKPWKPRARGWGETYSANASLWLNACQHRLRNASKW